MRFNKHIKYKNLFLILLFPLYLYITIHLSISKSRDYETYLEMIKNQHKSDLFFNFFVSLLKYTTESPVAIYSLYIFLSSCLMFFFFIKRKTKLYWIAIYFLLFYLLHSVTQIRTGMASFMVALLLTSRQNKYRLLIPIAATIHSSALLFCSIIKETNKILPIIIINFTLVSCAIFLATDFEKINLYSQEFNETKILSLNFIFSAFLNYSLLFHSKINKIHKYTILSLSISTFTIYFLFIDFKAISGRFLEISNAVTILYASTLDKKDTINSIAKKIIFLLAIFVFINSNFINSILI